ncbi:proline-rich protein 2-like [Oenanthe melanoleuca]|uniref:proline-rich protein 2-like n=1 Tax=Oenanthe melanoleuca TaxID=2939378 RepID=UPI0024C14C99|nr:proline-rich protein 2-like [Oenanthe melanoleuca]
MLARRGWHLPAGGTGHGRTPGESPGTAGLPPAPGPPRPQETPLWESRPSLPVPGDTHTARRALRGTPARLCPPASPVPPLPPHRSGPPPDTAAGGSRTAAISRPGPPSSAAPRPLPGLPRPPGAAAPPGPRSPPGPSAPPARRPWRSPRLRAPLAAPRPAEGRAGGGRGPPAAPHARRRQPPSLTYFPPGLPPDGAPLTYFPANGTLPRPRTGRASPPTGARLRARLAQWAPAERATPAPPSAGESPRGPAAPANRERGCGARARPPPGGGAEGRRGGAAGTRMWRRGRRGFEAGVPGVEARARPRPQPRPQPRPRLPRRRPARSPPRCRGSPEPLRHRRVTSAAAVTSRGEV